MRTTLKPVVIAAAFAAAITAITAGPAIATERHIVEIIKFKFVPAEVKAAPGDTIIWINKDIVPHTITAADKSWDSGTIAKAAEWQTVVRSDMPGAYFCRFHPAMKARFTVSQ